jgi:[glutamine synthetase] adenylyltransferase / [glutamine synthetase]-adenylyl-L-tyrosine phosphorylase
MAADKVGVGPLEARHNNGDRLRVVLNEFKDRELFRIDMRHILGHSGGVDQFGQEMTDLAEVVVTATVEFCCSELVDRYGSPLIAEGTGCRFAVCSLGKCGGRELGFASDIELLFVYEADAEPGLSKLDNASFFSRLVESVSHAIHARSEGVFRIDLRMRPYGRAGSLAVSLAAFRSYFQHDGPAWPYERQALVKLRPIAGDVGFGRQLIELRDELVFTNRPVDFGAIRAMRERQLRSLSDATEFNAKLSPGGLVDLEYLVQALQLEHGAEHRELRTANTREALDALKQFQILAADDHKRLCDAYLFLRRLIDALRMVRGDARDLTVPQPHTADWESLARRLGYGPQVERLRHELAHHRQSVTEVARLISAPANSDS